MEGNNREEIREVAKSLKNLGLDKAGISILIGKAQVLLEYQELATKRPA